MSSFNEAVFLQSGHKPGYTIAGPEKENCKFGRSHFAASVNNKDCCLQSQPGAVAPESDVKITVYHVGEDHDPAKLKIYYSFSDGIDTVILSFHGVYADFSSNEQRLHKWMVHLGHYYRI